MEQQQNLNENGTRRYSDLEVELLIDEISEAALTAIEQAASEAARAAMLAGLEREALAMREATLKQAEALRWQLEVERQMQVVKETKKTGIKNAIKAGVICLLSGLAIGIGGALTIGLYPNRCTQLSGVT
jgi:hypothetical protein